MLQLVLIGFFPNFESFNYFQIEKVLRRPGSHFVVFSKFQTLQRNQKFATFNRLFTHRSTWKENPCQTEKDSRRSGETQDFVSSTTPISPHDTSAVIVCSFELKRPLHCSLPVMSPELTLTLSFSLFWGVGGDNLVLTNYSLKGRR